MCEREYVACGGCNERADEHIRWIETRYYSETCSQSVDEDGDPNGDAEEYGDPEYSHESDGHFECGACGWIGNSLDTECVPDDCDCGECSPSIDTYNDPNEIVALTRRDQFMSHMPERDEPWPPEIEKLMQDRLIHFIPITRERAEELSIECSPELDLEVEYNAGARDPFVVQVDGHSIPPHVVEHLSIPNAREEVAHAA